VISLAGQVRTEVIINAVLDESVISQIRPEHGEHAEAVRFGEGLADLFDLADRSLGPK